MSKRFLVGLDIGEGMGRCLLVNIETKRVITSLRAWRHPTAPGTSGFGFNLQTDDIWSLLAEATREALDRAGAGPSDIAAIATAGQRHSTVVVDAENRVLFATPTRDARAASQAVFLAQERGADIYRITGHWPAPLFTAARLQWLAQNMPEKFSHAHAVISVSDWVGMRLSGECVVEASIASDTMLSQVGTRAWARDLIDWLGLPQALFPPVVSAGTRIGSLCADAAETLGIAPGTPVVAGGGDTQCGLVGAGATSAGKLGVVAGTTVPVQLVCERPIIDVQSRLWTNHHLVPGLWVMESNAGSMGEMLEWLARIFYPDVGFGVARLTTDASQSVPGARGMRSTLGTDIFNASQLNLPLGHLTLSHFMAADDPERRPHLARAVLEGMAFGLRANADQLLDTSGRQRRPFCMSGGMTRSAFWCQLVSDVLGAEVTTAPTSEASALGAALCAGVGVGLFADLSEAATSLATGGRTFVPNAEHRATYDELYENWLEVRAASAEADELAKSIALHSLFVHADDCPRQRPQSGFRPRILVTASIDEAALKGLRELGEVKYASFREQHNLLAGDDLIDALRGYQVFVTEVDVVDADVLCKLPDLRVIVTCRTNPVNIDVDACTAHGVLVLGTPGRNAEAVADLTVAFILMLARKLPEASQFLREPGSEAGDTARMGMAFERFCGREIGEKTIGLIGFGKIGKRVAARLHPFRARLLAFDPYISNEVILAAGAEPVPLDELLVNSDFVTVHAAITTGESRVLLDSEKLRTMKRGSFLVNTARAAMVDEAALVELLASGHLGGAALDVFSSEPPGADDPLLALPNVIATPHIAGDTVEVSTHQGKMVSNGLTRLLAGEKPPYSLNPQTLKQFSWNGPRQTPDAETLEKLKAKPGPAITDLEVEKQSVEPAARRNTWFFGKLANQHDGGDSKYEQAQSAPASKERRVSSKVRSHVQLVLNNFFLRMNTDANIQSFAKNQDDLTVCFHLLDIDLRFFMCFKSGAATTGMGEPPQSRASVTLKMTAETLDKLFTGVTSGPRLAMSGKLSFFGDTLKAISIGRLQKDINRVYIEARDAVGGIGEMLRALPPSTEPKAASLHPSASDERDELVRTVEEMYAAGVITSTGGNVSVRTSDNPKRIWITPNQLHKGELSAEAMVCIDLDGNPINSSSRAPSSERLIHCSILRNNSAANAVIHSHAPKATALALARLPFLPISAEAAFIGEIPRVPFIMPGTRDLARAVAEAIGTGSAVLMENHGLVVAGSDLRHAAALTLIIEQTAEEILLCYAAGKEPCLLSDHLVQSLRDLGQMIA